MTFRIFNIVVLLATMQWFASALGLRVVMTPSVAQGLYATSELVGEPKRGQYVCVEAKASEAPEALRLSRGGFPVLLKRVAGVAGDRIERTDRGVTVNGHLLPLSEHLGHDSEGRALPSPTSPLTLRAGEVWLTSEHPRGFDSRYFGPVRVGALSCEGRPLWTW